MNPFDIVIIIVVCYCVIRGAFRGIIKEASSIVGVIAGIWAAYTYYPNMAKALSGFANLFPGEGYINIISFMILFCVIFIGISALGVLLKVLLKIVFLGWVDKLCGASFGFIKSVLIVSMLLLILTTFLDKGAPLIKNSVLSPYIASASETMSRFGSKDLRHKFSLNIDSAKKAWEKSGGKTLPDPDTLLKEK